MIPHHLELWPHDLQNLMKLSVWYWMFLYNFVKIHQFSQEIQPEQALLWMDRGTFPHDLDLWPHHLKTNQFILVLYRKSNTIYIVKSFNWLRSYNLNELNIRLIKVVPDDLKLWPNTHLNLISSPLSCTEYLDPIWFKSATG